MCGKVEFAVVDETGKTGTSAGEELRDAGRVKGADQTEEGEAKTLRGDAVGRTGVGGGGDGRARLRGFRGRDGDRRDVWIEGRWRLLLRTDASVKSGERQDEGGSEGATGGRGGMPPMPRQGCGEGWGTR